MSIQATATAQVVVASARERRSVGLLIRWRWMLEVLQIAAWVVRNLRAEAWDLNR